MFAIPRRDFLLMLLTGALLAFSQAAYFAAIRAAGITIATLLTICVAPVVVTSVSVLLGHERLSRRVLVALGCALAGSALLVGFHAPDDAHTALGLGVVYSLISAVTYAGMIVCGRWLAAGYHPLQVTSVSFGTGALVLVLVNLAAGFTPTRTPQGWLLILYLGIVPTALAYWLFQDGLRAVSATAASIIGMLDPLVAALLAWALFGEILAASSLIGAALLLLGIVCLSLGAPQTPPAAEPPI
jgi:DME family drug/metabolite transporter